MKNEVNPPKSPIEVTITIGAETFGDLLSTMYNEIREWDRNQAVQSHIWGGAGTNGNVSVDIRDITPELYREELQAWHTATNVDQPNELKK